MNRLISLMAVALILPAPRARAEQETSAWKVEAGLVGGVLTGVAHASAAPEWRVSAREAQRALTKNRSAELKAMDRYELALSQPVGRDLKGAAQRLEMYAKARHSATLVLDRAVLKRITGNAVFLLMEAGSMALAADGIQGVVHEIRKVKGRPPATAIVSEENAAAQAK
ncbi:MAG: hypothetical protein HUU37_05410 [Bdellovibrionales bacterium]|nr:hypothetical protein [Bdellovibrionales bacterium]